MKTRRACFLRAAILILPPFLATFAAAEADLSITNTTVPNPALVRKNLTYNMNVINDGPDRATSVKVTDTLPRGVTVLRATFNFIDVNRDPQTLRPCTVATAATTTVTCDIGDMKVGRLAGAAVFIVVRPENIGVIENTATVTAGEADPDSATVETVVEAQVPNPVAVDPNLVVGKVIGGLSQPTGISFLGANDFLVLEKDTGRVKRVTNGVVRSTVLDLGVNSFSERGLLGIALHPDFAADRRSFVYLFWTCCSSVRNGPCEGLASPADSTRDFEVPLLGNRVDRFIWNGDSQSPTLTFDRNLIQLRALQEDANQPPRGNHDGGKILFGADRKLYIYMGDNGRRGWMQNITEGFGPQSCVPFKPAGVPCDDQFGGPEPNNAHLTGVILRLNDDGTTPEDNPFFTVGLADLPPGANDEVLANIHKVFAYGIRNGFGIAFDSRTGQLWESQNADDSGTEINRIEAGFNGGWVQIMGLLEGIDDYKEIETSPVYFGLQQVRWPPTLIADSPEEASDRMFKLPGARYVDPLLVWKFEIAPAGFGFIEGSGLGPQFDGDIILGGARDLLFGGHLFRLRLTPDRMDLNLSGMGLSDRVIEASDKWDITGSETLLFGEGFGITTDIRTGPNGHLFVVSLGTFFGPPQADGAVYEIQPRP